LLIFDESPIDINDNDEYNLIESKVERKTKWVALCVEPSSKLTNVAMLIKNTFSMEMYVMYELFARQQINLHDHAGLPGVHNEYLPRWPSFSLNDPLESLQSLMFKKSVLNN
jgi:hypothetical protein